MVLQGGFGESLADEAAHPRDLGGDDRDGLAEAGILVIGGIALRLGRLHPLILVTHQVNIRALTGQATRSGEVVVVALPPGEQASVLGRIPLPERTPAD